MWRAWCGCDGSASGIYCGANGNVHTVGGQVESQGVALPEIGAETNRVESDAEGFPRFSRALNGLYDAGDRELSVFEDLNVGIATPGSSSVVVLPAG